MGNNYSDQDHIRSELSWLREQLAKKDIKLKNALSVAKEMSNAVDICFKEDRSKSFLLDVITGLGMESNQLIHDLEKE